jgi:hypothetical protein
MPFFKTRPRLHEITVGCMLVFSGAPGSRGLIHYVEILLVLRLLWNVRASAFSFCDFHFRFDTYANEICPSPRLFGNLIQFIQDGVLKFLRNRKKTTRTKTSLAVSSLQVAPYTSRATELSGDEIVVVGKIFRTLRSNDVHRQVDVDKSEATADRGP